MAPVADAGSDQNVSEGAVVSLDGNNSSDFEGQTLSYQWTQTAGTTVTLENNTTATPHFTAPTGLTADENLIFSLVVNDGALDSAADTVQITVKKDSSAPVGSIIPSITYLIFY